MSTINDGGPAFPPRWDPKTHPSGMALRDYFAAKAMQAFVRTLCDKDQMQDSEVGDLIATLSYIQADAMLAARKPNPNQ